MGTIGVGVILDTNAPVIAITAPTSSPTYITTSPSLSLSGTTTDNVAVASVTWSNSRGGSGTATGTTSWTVSGITLQAGINVITVTASDASGNTGTDTLTVTYSTNVTVSVNVSGNGIVSPNLNGQSLALGRSITLTAKPISGNLFLNWTGSITSSVPTISFVLQSNMVLQVNFIPNPFPAVKGVYRGLFSEDDGVTQTNSGAFNITAGATGNFSGKLQMGAVKYALKGRFDATGAATVTVARSGLNALTLSLQLDLYGGSDQVTGTVSDGVWTASLTGNRAVFNSTSHIAPQAGRYTVIIPGAPIHPPNPVAKVMRSFR